MKELPTLTRYDAECPFCLKEGTHDIRGGKFIVRHDVGPSRVGKYDARFSVYCSLDNYNPLTSYKGHLHVVE